MSCFSCGLTASQLTPGTDVLLYTKLHSGEDLTFHTPAARWHLSQKIDRDSSNANRSNRDRQQDTHTHTSTHALTTFLNSCIKMTCFFDLWCSGSYRCSLHLWLFFPCIYVEPEGLTREDGQRFAIQQWFSVIFCHGCPWRQKCWNTGNYRCYIMTLISGYNIGWLILLDIPRSKC